MSSILLVRLTTSTINGVYSQKIVLELPWVTCNDQYVCEMPATATTYVNSINGTFDVGMTAGQTSYKHFVRPRCKKSITKAELVTHVPSPAVQTAGSTRELPQSTVVGLGST
jgi:hypothetical protein